MIGVFRAYVRRYFLQWLAWRGFAFTLVANQLVTPLISFAVWAVVAPTAGGLQTYFVSILIVQLMTVSYENHTFSTRIYSGDLQDDLLKPHPTFLLPFAENVAIRMWHVIIGSPIFLGLAVLTGFSASWQNVWLAIPAIIGASVLQFLFTYSLALSAFWTQQSHGIVTLGQMLTLILGGVSIPLTMVPATLRLLLTALPFSSMIGFPAEILAGSAKSIGRDFLLQVAWLTIALAIAYITWMRGLRKYTSVGA